MRNPIQSAHPSQPSQPSQPSKDAAQIKEKIISFLKFKGPSLPVQVAREINMNMIFAGAFLSELFAGKRIKISSMKVGGSPLYFLPGQEYKLENFSQHLNSKEKEAFNLLKENKFLSDSGQEPAIRVALRALKDFAFPFKNNEEVYWRYLTILESEFRVPEKIKEKIDIMKKIEEPIIQTLETVNEKFLKQETQMKEKQEILEETKPIKISERRDGGELNIFDKSKGRLKKPARYREKIKVKKRKSSTKEEKFFNQVKEYLSKKSIEILDIKAVNKDEIILKIKENNKERLLVAFNKKKISESDIIKAAKKASELNLDYFIFSLGEMPKNLSSLIEAFKGLSRVEKIE